LILGDPAEEAPGDLLIEQPVKYVKQVDVVLCHREANKVKKCGSVSQHIEPLARIGRMSTSLPPPARGIVTQGIRVLRS
jgi:hypothetical protein